jgi:hypothetical protein
MMAQTPLAPIALCTYRYQVADQSKAVMNADMQRNLFSCSPLTYRARRTTRETPLKRWGLQCGDEWFTTLREFSATVEAECARLLALGLRKRDLPRVTQVKERFNTLCFKVENCTPIVIAAILETEKDAEIVGEYGISSTLMRKLCRDERQMQR